MYTSYWRCRSCSSFSYSSMKAGRTVCRLRRRFSPRSRSALFFLIFWSSAFSSASRSSTCLVRLAMLSPACRIRSRTLFSMYRCSAAESRFPATASRKASAFSRARRAGPSAPSRSYSRAPRSVSSPASCRASLMFASWALRGVLASKSSPSAVPAAIDAWTLDALYNREASFKSSLTAYPSAAYRRFAFNLRWALLARLVHILVRNSTRSVSVSIISEIGMSGSYLSTIQDNISATKAKFGVRKFSTDISRGNPRDLIISVRFRSSRNDIFQVFSQFTDSQALVLSYKLAKPGR
mmetsp:Transcript_1973/g.3407  ORF Transcript_1973/g.3407 Transcript_1973/m.3407 type:complete len:295 (+) Transcript_1973:290-1174(+)